MKGFFLEVFCYIKSMEDIPEITEAMRKEARKKPNEWIYVIGVTYVKDGVEGAIRPEGIQGAFPVNSSGEIIPIFHPNHNYRKISCSR
jgi:hypothetical protein